MTPPFRHLFLRIPGDAALDAGVEMLAREEVLRALKPADWLRSLYLSIEGEGRGEDGLAHLLDGLLHRLPGRGATTAGTEWTLEVPGELVGAAQGRRWRAADLSRISLPVPAGDPDVVILAARSLREAGVERVSVDLPFGGEHWGADRTLSFLGALLQVGVQELALVDQTPEGGEGSVDDGSQIGRDPLPEGPTLLEALQEGLARAGLRSPDRIHYSPAGRLPVQARALHRREPVLGLGPGALTFRNPVRRRNTGGWRVYERCVASGSDPVAEVEWLTREEVRVERFWSRLRGGQGLPLRFLEEHVSRWLERSIRGGWLEVQEKRVHPTDRGWRILDGLVVELLAALDERPGPGGIAGSEPFGG